MVGLGLNALKTLWRFRSWSFIGPIAIPLTVLVHIQIDNRVLVRGVINRRKSTFEVVAVCVRGVDVGCLVRAACALSAIVVIDADLDLGCGQGAES